MNADYLAAKELAVKERDVAEKKRANLAEEAERYRSNVAQIRQKDMDRIAQYGYMAGGNANDPVTGQIYYDPNNPNKSWDYSYGLLTGPNSPGRQIIDFVSNLFRGAGKGI